MVGNNLAYSWIRIWDCQISRPMLNVLSYWDSYARNKPFINLRRGSAMEWSVRRLRGVQTSCRHIAGKSEWVLRASYYIILIYTFVQNGGSIVQWLERFGYGVEVAVRL